MNQKGSQDGNMNVYCRPTKDAKKNEEEDWKKGEKHFESFLFPFSADFYCPFGLGLFRS